MNLTLPQIIGKRADHLKAVAHPVRLQLIMLLRQAPDGFSVTEAQRLVAIDYTTVSHHLSLLRGKGLVTARIKGNERWYLLSDTRLADAVCSLFELA
nr:metalloregulator ArsR/SmtB family transcription factor [uncultured Arsenicibacter sp.]